NDAAATIEVAVAGQTVAATNNADGTWSLADDTLTALAEGTFDVSVTATDAVGNAGSDATTDELVVTSTMRVGADAFASAAENEVRLLVDGDQLRAVDSAGADVVPSRLLSEIVNVVVTGQTGVDDTLVVTASAIPAGGVSFDGGGTGSDSLAIGLNQAESVTSLSVVLLGANTGTADVDGQTVSFINVASVDSSGLAALGSHSIEYADSDDNIAVTGTTVSDGLFAYQADSLDSLTINGGGGNDNIDASASTGAVTLVGGNGDDVLLGGPGNDVLNGNDGNDLVSGGGGDDSLLGEAGNDTLKGGGGIDTISGGDDDDLLRGQGGVLNALDGGAGNDTVQETGDTNFTLTDASLASSLSTHILNSIELAILRGGDGANTLDASDFSGQTTLVGLAGNDSLIGGSSDDVIRGNDGNDTMLGHDGNDRVLAGTGNDGIAGGAGNDTLNGNSGDDSIFGGLGDDTLFGGAGADALLGEDGDDSLNGNGGGDTVAGGDGTDSIADINSEIDEAFELFVDWID
ncbi:MAG: hypothetical protein VX304_11260, partial [Planctomycetota bacterium]|nr:hypothetical protein [Planctomycetota bacterium]